MDATIVGPDAVKRETNTGVDVGTDTDVCAGGRPGDNDRTGADTGAEAYARINANRIISFILEHRRQRRSGKEIGQISRSNAEI